MTSSKDVVNELPTQNGPHDLYQMKTEKAMMIAVYEHSVSWGICQYISDQTFLRR